MADSETNKFQELIESLSSQNKEEKLLAISAMGVLKIPEHSDRLVDLLSSNDEEVVEKVIITLGQIGNPSSIKHIVEFILDDKGKLSKVAYEVLKKFYSVSAVDYLIKCASSDQPPEIRYKLISLISRYEDIRVAALMNEIMGQTKDIKVLVEAISYFIRFPLAERHTALKMLSTKKGWEVSLAANIALSRLKDTSAFAQITRLMKSPNVDIRDFIVTSLNYYPIIEDRKLYQELFDDVSPIVREKSIKGLGMFAADERITLIKRWINREKDPSIFKLLIHQAAKEKSPFFLDIFIKLMAASKEMKKLAYTAIIGMGKPIIDRLATDFDSYSLVVKEQIILIIGKLGGEKVVPILLECFKAKSKWLQINSIEASVNIGSEEIINELVSMLQDEKIDNWVKATLISALGKIGNKTYIDLIASNLRHADARVRANAIEALSLLEWAELLNVYPEILKDRNDRVRVNVAIALWKSGSQDIFSELESMSKDKSKWVRASAVFAMGKIGNNENIPLVLSMLNDPEDVVYVNVIDALADSGDLRALSPLIKESVSGRFPYHFYKKYLDIFSDKIRQ